MTAKLFTLPKQVPFTNAGELIPGAKAYFYLNGTSTPQDTYTTSALSVAHTNPVVADGNGKFPAIFLDGTLRYKVKLTDASDVEIYTLDDFQGLLDASEVGSALYPQTSAESTAGVTPTNYEYEPGNVLRYGATGDGVTDDTTALANWLSVIKDGRGYIPKGVYNHTGLTLDPQYSYNIVGDAYDGHAIGGTVLVNTDTSGGHAITIDNTPFTVNYDSQIRLTNLTIKGNASSGDGINADQTMVFLENVWITGNGGNGYYALRCYSSAFRQVSFSNNSQNGFQANRALNAVHFDHCLFNGNAATTGYSGCALGGAAGIDRNFGVKFTSCDFTNNGADLASGNAYGIAIQQSAGVTLDGCYGEGNYTHNIYADGTASNLTITGGFWQDADIELRDVVNLVFERNLIYDSGSAVTSVIIDGGLPDSRYPHRIEGNEYVGTITKTFSGGATQSVHFRDDSAPTGGSDWIRSDIVWNSNIQNKGEVLGWVAQADGSPDFIPMNQLPGCFANHGDAAATLTPRASFPTNVWASPLTADRAVTLSTTNAFSGCSFRITRTAGATGAFNLNVGTGPLKALVAGTWCDVEYDGSGWILTAYGSL